MAISLSQNAGIMVGVAVLVVIIMIASLVTGKVAVEWILLAVMMSAGAMYATKFYVNHTAAGFMASQLANLSTPMNISTSSADPYTPSQSSSGSSVNQYMPQQ